VTRCNGYNLKQWEEVVGILNKLHVTASSTAIFLAVLVGIIMYRRGVKIGIEEIIEEEELTTKIKDVVKGLTENAVLKIEDEVSSLENTFRSCSDQTEDEVKRSTTELGGKIEQIESIVRGYNIIVQGYNEMCKQYRGDEKKREMLMLQIEEVARLEEEYRRKLELLQKVSLDTAEAAELVHDKALLTREDGLASREKGISAQKETAQYLRSLGFELEEYYGIGAPDYIYTLSSRRVAVGPHRAFTLTREGTKQRTVTKDMIKVEYDTAMKLKLPMVIMVMNLVNKRRWGEFISYDKLKDFERVTTPLILAEDTRESQKILDDSIIRIREILGYKKPENPSKTQ